MRTIKFINGQRGGVKVVFLCDYCGKEAIKRKDHFENSNHKFCGRNCYANFVSEIQKTEEHNSFKSNGKIGYFAKHQRIYKRWKKTGVCDRCGFKPKTRTEWSNNGNYDPDDRNDWEELCGDCHKKKDMTLERRKKTAKPVVRFGDTKEVYWGIHEASRKTGILASAIANCLGGRSKTAGGFKWRYI